MALSAGPCSISPPTPGWATCWGFALERKELGQRLSVTYHSEVRNQFRNHRKHSGHRRRVCPCRSTPASPTPIKLPQSVEIAAQTGLNPKTLLFGSIRWSDWSKFTLAPPAFGRSLASIGDAWTIEVGVGRRFSEKFSGSLAFTHELDGGSVVSPLGPNNGLNAITLGGKYQATERVAISGGMRYTMLGNAGTNPGIPLAVNFRNNDAISFGLKVGINLN
jgi:long-chain fatty acid transport protein